MIELSPEDKQALLNALKIWNNTPFQVAWVWDGALNPTPDYNIAKLVELGLLEEKTAQGTITESVYRITLLGIQWLEDNGLGASIP